MRPPPSPWFSQPDPSRPYFVAAKATKLVRRGRRYFLVGRLHDGSEVEIRLIGGTFQIDGLA